MKVGIVTTWFERGAAYVSKQFRDVLAQEHDVAIYARGGEEFAIGDANWDFDYVTWGKYPLSYAFTDINLDDFKDWLLKEKIELVLFNEQKIWAAPLLCREMGVKVGCYIDYYTEQTVPMFGVYDFLICNTKRHLSVFDWHPQCLYFPWGTDISLYNLTAKKDDLEQPLTFFHSAGMSPHRKGTDLTIKAFDKVKGNARLIIHSQVSLTKAYPKLVKTINQLVEDKKLELHEYTVSAPGLYHLGDVYVYPSRLDGIGLTILEAAASGLPIIVPDNAPMNEFVEKGVNGKVAKIDKLWSRTDGYYWPQCEVNINSLAKQMQYYVTHSEQKIALKKQARQYAAENYCWTKNTSSLCEDIKNIFIVGDSLTQEVINEAQDYDARLFKRHKKTKRQFIINEFQYSYPEAFQYTQNFWRKIKKFLG